MSKILCFLAFVLWLIVFMFMGISIVGLVALIVMDEDTYMSLGEYLVKGIKGDSNE